MLGVVKWFNEQKGYGFIKQVEGADLFVHVSGVSPGLVLEKDMSVSYEVIDGNKGPQAAAVNMRMI